MSSLAHEALRRAGRPATAERQLGVVMLMNRFHPFVGGYQTQSLRLGQKLLGKDVDVHVVTARFGVLPRYEVHQGIPIHRVTTFGRGHLSALSYLVSSFVWMIRHRKRFHVVHANRVSSGVVAGVIGFVLGKRVLCRPARGEELDVLGRGLFGRLKLECLRRTVDRFVAITRGIEADLEGLGIARDRIVRVDNGVDLEAGDADGAATRASLGWNEAATVVTFVGRLVAEKGVDWLLDAWRGVARENAGARLLVVGDGPEAHALRERAERLGISDSVRFVGNRSNVFPYLAASDVFILPSRLEGSSNALLEAMSRALPVVVGDDRLGGNRELVDDGVEGFVVPLDDEEALRARLVELVRKPLVRAVMGKHARQRVERHRSIDVAADRYREIYASLVGISG
ncbi:MAG: glycosyltransferase family 4 protein [Candidatus Binatia bacterium]